MSDPPADSTRDRRTLRDLSPGAKLVLAAIEADGGATTHADLVERTLLTDRGVFDALRRLRDAGLIGRSAHGSDARRTVYAIRDDTPTFFHVST